MSIVQDGVGFPVLHPSVYNYMCTGKYIGVAMLDENIPDPLIRHFVEKVSIIISCTFR